jgi:prepilin-type N-terminal cleavage/methylation domain-containing protein
MKKLPAFTLMELLIGMIISSIVISFGYMAYQLVNEQYLSYKTMKGKLMETTQFNTTFADDIDNAEIVSSEENKIILRNKNAPELEYEFLPASIVRKRSELTDTFKIATTNIKQSFLFPEDNMFLQQFSFEVNMLGEAEFFHFTKNYSSEILMNYKTTKVNP